MTLANWILVENLVRAGGLYQSCYVVVKNMQSVCGYIQDNPWVLYPYEELIDQSRRKGSNHLLIHSQNQVPGFEVKFLMRTFNMRSLLFPLAGSITALLNCQGPLDAPIFVGTGMASRTFSSLHVDTPTTVVSKPLAKSEAGALAAFDRVPFSHVSANFTFNTNNYAS